MRGLWNKILVIENGRVQGETHDVLLQKNESTAASFAAGKEAVSWKVPL